MPKLVNRGAAGLLTKVQHADDGGAKPAAVKPLWRDAPKNRVAVDLKGMVVPISSLKYDPVNARLHPERNMEAIKDSLCQFGQLSPLVVRAQDRVVAAGNGRMRAASELGWTHMAAVVQEMTDEEFVGFAIADNRSSELAMWDFKNLAALDKILQKTGASPIGWTSDEVRTLRKMDWDDPVGDEDAVPEPPKVPVTKPGDVWLMGNHRLVCGDSTDPAVAKKAFGDMKPQIMVTDPPYGVDYDPNWRNEANRSLGGNAKIGASAVGLVNNDTQVNWEASLRAFPGDVMYVWHAGLHAGTAQQMVLACGFSVRSQIIWVKSNFAISRGAYHWRHEPCWYAVRDGKAAAWGAGHDQSTVWDVKKNAKSETGHSTQKPVECMARPMRNHGEDGWVAYDPFVGSGTAVIAAQKENRVCCAIELDPVYCDVVVARWEAFTGKKARRGK